MNEKRILLHKSLSLTSFQAIEKLRASRPELTNARLAFAGRLDPQARGLLVVLVGEECKNRDYYHNLDKTYEFTALLGIATDTDDIMGRVLKFQQPPLLGKQMISQKLQELVGTFPQDFPAYSSKLYQGKPMFYWASIGKLPEVHPQKLVTVYSISKLVISLIEIDSILPEVISRIASTKGEFRQSQIISDWREVAAANSGKRLIMLKATAVVSSGTYIRSLCSLLGEKLGLSGIAYDIYRTRVGPFLLESDTITV